MILVTLAQAISRFAVDNGNRTEAKAGRRDQGRRRVKTNPRSAGDKWIIEEP